MTKFRSQIKIERTVIILQIGTKPTIDTVSVSERVEAVVYRCLTELAGITHQTGAFEVIVQVLTNRTVNAWIYLAFVCRFFAMNTLESC